MLNKKDKMHPNDIRNLLIFAVVSIALWSLYEIYVLTPQKEALQKRAHIEKLIEQKERETGVEIVRKTVVRPRAEVLAEAQQRLTIDNGRIFGSLNLTGARLDDIGLADYFETLERENHVKILSPKDTEYPRYIEHGWVAQDANIKLPDADTQWAIRGNNKLDVNQPVTLVWDNGQGITFEREYTVDENFLIQVEQKIINNTQTEVALFPYALISQTGLPRDLENIWIMHEGMIGFFDDELKQITYNALKKDQREEAAGTQGWIGITDKYWLNTLIPPQDQNVQYRFRHTPNIKDVNKGRFQVDYTATVLRVPPGGSDSVTSHMFVGAKEVAMLSYYESVLEIPNLDLSVDFGWFWFMTQPFFYILHWLYELIGNMGVSIIVLTVIIRMLTYPLTSTSFHSFAKMKLVNPQVVELRDIYKDDKVRLQEEIVKLYQKEGVNPMSGCFPILIQIPIFFSLYKVFFVTIEMRHEPFFGWIKDLSAPDPTSLFNLFGALPYGVPAFLMIGVWPCLMLIVMLIQKKLNPPPQDKFQRDLMNIFPFLITFFMARFASGLVIYWTFSGFISMLQQMYIMRKLGAPIYLFGEKEEEQIPEDSPDVHPLSEMAEQDIKDALSGEDADKDEPVVVSPPKPKKKKKKK